MKNSDLEKSRKFEAALNKKTQSRKPRIKAEKCPMCGHVLKNHKFDRLERIFPKITDLNVTIKFYCPNRYCYCVYSKIFAYLYDVKEDGAKEEKIGDNSRKILWD